MWTTEGHLCYAGSTSIRQRAACAHAAALQGGQALPRLLTHPYDLYMRPFLKRYLTHDP